MEKSEQVYSIIQEGIVPFEECHGPFAYCPPPDPLTEEEWELITEKEYHRYAS